MIQKSTLFIDYLSAYWLIQNHLRYWFVDIVYLLLITELKLGPQNTITKCNITLFAFEFILRQ